VTTCGDGDREHENEGDGEREPSEVGQNQECPHQPPPANMAATEARRRPRWLPPPPTARESAAMPVMVRGRTVVVKSGTFSDRAVAF
jgi:hypothetical protein